MQSVILLLLHYYHSVRIIWNWHILLISSELKFYFLLLGTSSAWQLKSISRCSTYLSNWAPSVYLWTHAAVILFLSFLLVAMFIHLDPTYFFMSSALLIWVSSSASFIFSGPPYFSFLCPVLQTFSKVFLSYQLLRRSHPPH